jgi:hypothetical protein
MLFLCGAVVLHIGMNPPYLPALAIMAGANMAVAGLMWIIADAKGTEKAGGIPADNSQEEELVTAEIESPHTLETVDEPSRLLPPKHYG